MNDHHLNEKLEQLAKVGNEMAKVIVGQREVVNQILISLLAGGHCLLEGVPGLAKTLMVSTLAKTLAMDFRRVQFTPDLMPSDIIGTEILEQDHTTGERFFKFQQGPVFTHLLLADEINRTPPKTQAALLEAMQEKRVSYGGTSYDLPQPFFVLATQNPLEQAGTYGLPEAQLDRFLLFVKVGYPNRDEEVEILLRTTGEVKTEVSKILSADDVVQLQALTRQVEISNGLIGYCADLVRATRNKDNTFIQWGAGPRAGQALVLCAKASALLDGRFAVTPLDVKAIAKPVLRHRILLNFAAQADGVSCDDVIDKLLSSVSLSTNAMG